MEINTPLHGYVHLWAVGILIATGYAAIVINKAIKHHENRKITNIILAIILLIYTAGYSYLCFFYRTPANETHIQLKPFWSYKEAFGVEGIARLGLARSIILNILITVPLGCFLPAVYRNTSHRYRNTFLTILLLSIITELTQYLTKTGLCETDDLIDNVLGGVIGLLAYIIADIVLKARTDQRG